MAFTIKLTFPAGQYHATPWGRHVNEGVPEWPPSPWRLLRALVAVWKRTAPEISESQFRRALEPLAQLPRFRLPPHRVAHTRHYMPWEKKGPADRTLVFDTFVSVGRDEPLFIGWPGAGLSDHDRPVLTTLLDRLSSFGRAESWVHAELCDGSLELPIGTADPTDANPLPVLCADPTTVFSDEHYPSFDPARLAKGKVNPADFLFDCPRWHLCLDTETIHRERWPAVPGAKWVQYTRPLETIAVTASAKPTVREAPTIARFLLDGPVLPLITDTLPVAEAFRAAAMCQFERGCRREPRAAGAFQRRDRPERFASPVLAGKDADGQPRLGHAHAYYLASAEASDGRLDHVTVHAADGFGPEELAALAAIRELHWGDRTLAVRLVGLGQPNNVRAPLLGPARTWVSATPLVASRYPKRSGTKRDRPETYATARDFVEHVLHEELDRLRDRLRQRGGELPAVQRIDALDACLGSRRLRPIQFQRFRNKQCDDGGRRPCGAFRITFAAPIQGPISLGHSSHFGLGLFLPGKED